MLQQTHFQERHQPPTARIQAATLGSVVLLTALMGLLVGACTSPSLGLPSTSEIAGAGSQDQLAGAPPTPLTSTTTTMFIPLVESTTATDKPSDLSDLEIYMEKTACEGPCPVYSVIVRGDGAVLYNGRTCVNVVGERSDQISQDEVGELVDAFYRNDFFSLEDAYVEDVQDVPSVQIHFTLRDQAKQVISRVYDPRKLPEAFTLVEDAIDSIANTQQWVMADGTPAPCP